jgi:hypothetical protein
MTEEDRAKIQQIMQDLAKQVLQQEQMQPGQDPELIQWAMNKLEGVETSLPAAAPVPAGMTGLGGRPAIQQAAGLPPEPSQPPLPPAQPAEPEVAQDGSEGVLHIQRTPDQTPGATIQPTQSGGTASNDTQDNGERNGNSN